MHDDDKIGLWISSVASGWLASFSTNCHFLVNNSRNKIVKILKIFMDIDHLRS